MVMEGSLEVIGLGSLSEPYPNESMPQATTCEKVKFEYNCDSRINDARSKGSFHRNEIVNVILADGHATFTIQ